MASRAHRWKGDDTPLTGVNYYDRDKKGLDFYFGAPKKARAAMARPSPIKPEETAGMLANAQRLEQMLSKLPPLRQRLYERSQTAAREVIERARKDRLRPRAKGPAEMPRVVYRKARDMEVCRQHRILLFDAQDGLCGSCGKAIDCATRGTLDHVVPLYHGGADKLGNLLLMHSECNGLKSNRMPNRFEKKMLEKVNAQFSARQMAA